MKKTFHQPFAYLFQCQPFFSNQRIRFYGSGHKLLG